MATGARAIGGFFGFGNGAEEAIPPSTAGSGTRIDNENNVTIQNVNVQTQATDAEGISKSIGKQTKNAFENELVADANSGVVQ
jgi:hypothetical protein